MVIAVLLRVVAGALRRLDVLSFQQDQGIWCPLLRSSLRRVQTVPDSAPTHRALRLLELFQARRVWTGSELAQRLGTDARTLRRDIERLRGLGYSIQTRRGPGGGYRLSTGSDVPPLLFTPDEALAVAAALASSAASGSAGGGELALTALAKIEQVMPARARRRMRALRSSVSLAETPNAAAGAYPTPLYADVLGVLALACRDR